MLPYTAKQILLHFYHKQHPCTNKQLLHSQGQPKISNTKFLDRWALGTRAQWAAMILEILFYFILFYYPSKSISDTKTLPCEHFYSANLLVLIYGEEKKWVEKVRCMLVMLQNFLYKAKFHIAHFVKLLFMYVHSLVGLSNIVEKRSGLAHTWCGLRNCVRPSSDFRLSARKP